MGLDANGKWKTYPKALVEQSGIQLGIGGLTADILIRFNNKAKWSFDSEADKIDPDAYDFERNQIV